MKAPLAVAFFSLLLTSVTQAASGWWDSDSSGNWSDGTAWQSGVVADGADAEARFDAALTAARTITNDAGTGTWSGGIGHLRFGNSGSGFGWTLSGGTLTLETTSGKPTVFVDTDTEATFATLLAGTNGFAKEGSGTLVLTGANPYTGGTTIHVGRLALRSTQGRIASSPVTVQGGAALEFAPAGSSGDRYGDNLALYLNDGGSLTLGDTTTGGLNRETIGEVQFGGNAKIHLLRRGINSGDRTALTVTRFTEVATGVMTFVSTESPGNADTGTDGSRFGISLKEAPTQTYGMLSTHYISLAGNNTNFLQFVPDTDPGATRAGWLAPATYVGIGSNSTFQQNSGLNALGSIYTNNILIANTDYSYAALKTQRSINGTGGTLTLLNGGLILLAGAGQSQMLGMSANIDFNVEGMVYASQDYDGTDFSGKLTSTNGFIKAGAKAIVLSNAANDFGGGPVTIAEGTLRIGGGDDRLPTDSALHVGDAGTFDLAGHHQQVANLEGTGQIVNGSASTTSRLTVENTAAGTFAGVIKDGLGALGVTKTGVGTLILSGDNRYSGTTLVNEGTLLIQGDQSAATGAITVATGATLGGSGVIGGATVVHGTLAPGNSPGLLTFAGDLTLASDARSVFELGLNTGRGSTYDAVDIGGLFTYGGDLVLTLSGTYEYATWDLFDFGDASWDGNFQTVTLSGDYIGALSFNGSVWSGIVGGQAWSFDQSTGQFAAVPEPSTWAVFGLGTGLLAVWRRRKRVG